MKNRILKLVLSKQYSKDKVLLNKSEGNITALISGMMFLTITIIIVMFNFRVAMLSEVIYTIDDTLTASALGAITANSDAYTYSSSNAYTNQLILQDDEVYSGSPITKVAYTGNEKAVLVSELNSKMIGNGRYDSAKLNNSSNIYTASNVASLTRVGYNSSYNTGNEWSSYINAKTAARTIQYNEAYTLRTLNNLVGLTYNNLTNGKSNASKVNKIFDNSASKGITADVANLFTLNKNGVVKTSFVGQYVASNIDITRAEVYNVYRYTLARRHIYASPYFNYAVNGNGGYTWDGYTATGASNGRPNITLSNGTSTHAVKDMINITTNSHTGIDIYVAGWNGPTTEEGFKDYILSIYPALVVPGRANAGVGAGGSDYNQYYLLRAMWQLDLAAWNNRGSVPLIFWEDTGISCQIDWWSNNNDLNRTYGYMWNNSSTSVIKISNSVLATDTLANGTVRRLLPIEGYSSYVYVKGNSRVLSQYNNWGAYQSPGNGGIASSLNSLTRDTIQVGDYNKSANSSGTVINSGVDDASSNSKYSSSATNSRILHSAVYVEGIYSIATFPNNGAKDNMWHLGKFGTTDIRVARLVSITKVANN